MQGWVFWGAATEVLLLVELSDKVAFGVEDGEVAVMEPDSNDTLGEVEDALAAAIVLETMVIDPLRLPLVIVESPGTLVLVKSLDGTTLVVETLEYVAWELEGRTSPPPVETDVEGTLEPVRVTN